MKKKRTFSYFTLIKYILIVLAALLIIKFIIDNIVTILWTILLIALIGGSLAIMIYSMRKEFKNQKSAKEKEEIDNYQKTYFSNLKKEQQKQHEVARYSKAPYFQNESDFIDEPQNQTQEQTYRAKQRLITKNEESYLKAIENCIDHNLYDIHSQIPLSSIVEKIDHSRYHNELFRSIDFLITDKEQKPLLCIEINDKTHNRFDRQERDHKVQGILHEAGIPLVTFWTKYGVNEKYISKRINEILQSHS